MISTVAPAPKDPGGQAILKSRLDDPASSRWKKRLTSSNSRKNIQPAVKK